MIRFLLLFLITFFSHIFIVNAQPIVELKTTANETNSIEYLLQNKFKSYKIVSIEVTSLYQQLQAFNDSKNLELIIDDSEKWSMELWPDHRLVENMKIRTTSNKSAVTNLPLPYKGIHSDQSSINLTINEDVVYLYKRSKEGGRYIEPLHDIIPGQAKDLFIVYNGEDIIHSNNGNFCTALQTEQKLAEIEDNQDPAELIVDICYELELSIASDFLMFEKYDDADGVIAHNVNVMNNVQGNYDDEFDDEIQFVIVEQFISDCSTCDPWTSSTSAGTLLNSFTNWGPNGFEETHDLGQIWTARDFDGGTVGIAWVGAVCTNMRYHALSDFTNNAGFLRVMTAHEIGHNFNADHDASGSDFIMAPAVSNATNWSVASENDIQNHINSRNCLAVCAPPLPPVADFYASLQNLCPGTTTQFFDNSTNNPNTWNWSFPGGSPSSSDEENPIVEYSLPGTFDVTLTTGNDIGNDSQTKSGYITVGSGGIDIVFFDDFENGLTEWTITNPDNNVTWESFNAPGSSGNDGVAYINNYDYNAAGQEDYMDSPVYDLTGRTDINLDLEYAYARYNGNNSDIMRIWVSTNGGLTYPFMVFMGQENGNGSFATVDDMTSNFIPSSSSEWCINSNFGPDCISINLDDYIGTTEFSFRIENETGYGNNLFIDNVSLTSSCLMLDPPVADFSSDVNLGCTNLIVQYEDLSTNSPSSWFWEFPGGTPSTSTDQNPVVIYDTEGIFDVTLVASNDTGDGTENKVSYVEVLDVPTASFTSTINGNIASFINTSSGNSTYFDWDFGDGTSSTEENPNHVYLEDGDYIVILTAGNECGESEFQTAITIETSPTAGFSANHVTGCLPFVVQFNNESSDNTQQWAWEFPGGTPSSSNEVNPLVTYNLPGVFSVTLTVTNGANSDVLVMDNLITVLDLPEADFSFVVDQLTTTFTNASNNADSYSWDFGDGNGSTDANPIHTYAQEGIYTVTLSATNECGTVDFQKEVEITSIPIGGFTSNTTSGCVPLEVQFSDNSSANVESWLWTFEGGNPTTSTDPNPLVLYENSGSFDVSLVVTNSEGSDEVILTNHIIVGLDPVANFSWNAMGDDVDFINESVDADSYLWDFGDGNSTTMANPTHNYILDGTYQVTMTANNGCGTDVITFPITIISEVTASATANITSGCAPLTVQFTNTSSINAENYAWTFPGGTPNTSNEENPVVVYNEKGIFDVILEVSNSQFSDEITLTNYIVVDVLPTVDFNFDITDLSVMFTNTTINADSYSWTFGDGASSSQMNPTHVFDSEDQYSVTLMATNDCGTVELTKIINVSSSPTADFSYSNNIGCAPLSVAFEDQSSSNTSSWLWTFPGGTPNSSTEQNPTVVYNTPGIYDVSLIASNNSGNHEIIKEKIIEIKSLPTADFDFTINGATVAFQNMSLDADSYEWTFEGISGSNTEENPNITFEADGIYEVELTATNECGSHSKSIEIEITGYPNPSISSDGNTGCAPFEVVYEDISTDDVQSRIWDFPGGTPNQSTDQNPTVIYNTPGTYSVTLSVTNQVGEAELMLSNYILVEESPDANFDFSINEGLAKFSPEIENADSYFWEFGDGETSNETSPEHIFLENGDYDVSLTITVGNCSTTLSKTISVLVSINQTPENGKLEIYPNPTDFDLFINFEAVQNGIYTYSMIDILGETVLTGTWDLTTNMTQQILQFDFSSGVYILNVQGKNVFLSEKIVVQK